MAIASTNQLSAADERGIGETGVDAQPKRKPRFRPWMIAPAIILALAIGMAGHYALLVRDALTNINSVTTPAAVISGSELGGSASVSIDTGAARTAIAQAASGTKPAVAMAAAVATTSPTAAPVQSTATAVSVAALHKKTATATSASITGSAAEPSPTAAPSATRSQIERVANGDFEQGMSGWYTSDDVAAGGDHVHGGSQAMAIGVNGGYASQRLFSTAGSTYEARLWGRLSASGQTGTAGIMFYDADGAKITPAPATLQFTSAKWIRQTFTYTVPAGASSVELFFWKPSSDDVFFIDDVSVRDLVPPAADAAVVLTPSAAALVISTPDAASSGASTPSATSSDGSMNILLMGVDARPGEAIDIGVRPDSLMVLHLDNRTGSCRVLSIPRDTRTNLPGYGLTKINHALAVGGVDYEELIVQNLLGLSIDHYVLADFDGFQGLIDAVGGITIDVPLDFTSADGIVFVAGTQTMSGRQALSYARWRGGPDGDFGRIGRQQQVLRALVARASGMNILRSLNELLPVIQANLRTDLSVLDMASIASTFKSRCTQANVTMLTLDGHTATYQDPLLNLPLSYVILDPKEISSKVAALLKP